MYINEFAPGPQFKPGFLKRVSSVDEGEPVGGYVTFDFNESDGGTHESVLDRLWSLANIKDPQRFYFAKYILLRSGPPAPFTAYKLVTVSRYGEFVSLYDDSKYEIGEARVEQAMPNHMGGYYVYMSPTELADAWNSGGNMPRLPGIPCVVMLECECGGPIVEYDNGKVAVSFCRPVRVLGRWNREIHSSQPWIDPNSIIANLEALNEKAESVDGRAGND